MTAMKSDVSGQNTQIQKVTVNTTCSEIHPAIGGHLGGAGGNKADWYSILGCLV